MRLSVEHFWTSETKRRSQERSVSARESRLTEPGIARIPRCGAEPAGHCLGMSVARSPDGANQLARHWWSSPRTICDSSRLRIRRFFWQLQRADNHTSCPAFRDRFSSQRADGRLSERMRVMRWVAGEIQMISLSLPSRWVGFVERGCRVRKGVYDQLQVRSTV